MTEWIIIIIIIAFGAGFVWGAGFGVWMSAKIVDRLLSEKEKASEE